MADNSALPTWHHRHEPKYQPANDNQPIDESGQSAGFGFHDGGYVGTAGGLPAPIIATDYVIPRARYEKYMATGQYIGLTRKIESNVIPFSRPLHTLESLAALPGFIYLGSPYAKYPAGLVEANRVVSTVAGILMKRGLRIYCPIAHGHAVSQHQELPRDWDFWKSQDQPLIDAASAIVVLEMRGWYESVGLTYEIECFMKARKPIVYVEPSALGAEEVA